MYPHRFFFFFFNDTATTEIYTLSLHDRSSDLCNRSSAGLPRLAATAADRSAPAASAAAASRSARRDRKSTRLNSSHLVISYAVFCLKKKNRKHIRSGRFLHEQEERIDCA